MHAREQARNASGQNLHSLTMQPAVSSLPRPLSTEILFRPVESRNAFEETVSRLEQAITLGFVMPGERLPSERRLVELLQVSRTTVREAIRVLQKTGYVKPIRGRAGGSTVIARSDQVTEKDARRLVRELGEELFQLLDQRRVLESGAAELAAERATRDDMKAVYRLIEQERPRIPRASNFHRLHPQVHIAIAQLSKSSQLVSMITDLHYRLNDLIVAARVAQATVLLRDVSHKAVVDAIARHDARQARRLMTRHLLVTERFLRSYANH